MGKTVNIMASVDSEKLTEQIKAVCKRELCNEFKEWLSTQFTEVADTSKFKPLSIENIKKELMDAFLSDMRIINSFSKKSDKITDYIRRNVFDYLNEVNSCTRADSYICFDVAQRNNNYEVYVVIKTHKDILDKDGENRLDYLANIVEGIVRKAYPYMTKYENNPKMCANQYAERHIYFSLNNVDKENYESETEEIATNPKEEISDIDLTSVLLDIEKSNALCEKVKKLFKEKICDKSIPLDIRKEIALLYYQWEEVSDGY